MAALFARLMLVLAAAAAAQVWTGAMATKVCPINRQRFVSMDLSLLPISNVETSSEDTGFNPTSNFVSLTTPPWCTAEGQGRNPGHHVNLTFTEPVVIHFLESGGFFNGFVNNFTIEYSMSDSGDDFEAYGVLEKPQPIIVEDILFHNAYFSLEQPIVARRFKLRINGGELDTSNRLCWQLSLFGCELEQARDLPSSDPTTVPPTTRPEATTESTSQTPTTPPPSPPEATPRGLLTEEELKEVQTQILIIAVPVALGTIVIVFLVAVVGVAICICTRRKRMEKNEKMNDHRYEPVTVRVPNNRRTRQTIPENTTGDATTTVPMDAATFNYDCPRPLSYDVPRMSVSARSRSSADVSTTEVRNPMYIAKQNSEMHISSTCNDYEAIPEATENKLYELHKSPRPAHSTPAIALPPALPPHLPGTQVTNESRSESIPGAMTAGGQSSEPTTSYPPYSLVNKNDKRAKRSSTGLSNLESNSSNSSGVHSMGSASSVSYRHSRPSSDLPLRMPTQL